MVSVYNLDETCLETPKRCKGDEAESHLMVTGTIDDPFWIPSDTPKREICLSGERNKRSPTFRTTPRGPTPKRRVSNCDGYYSHKFLLKLRRKQYDNNFDLGLYFALRFGGPKSSMGCSLLNDDELLECSELSKFKSKQDLNEWFEFQYKTLHRNLRKRMDLRNLTVNQVNRRVSRELARKRWFTREKLLLKVVEQESWNPFSIFGSSLPYVSLNDVFNLESSKNYIVGNIKRNIGKEVGCEVDEDIFKYLDKKWHNESKKVTYWTNDPLVTTEVLWYIYATNKYVDKSHNVCVLQKCFCVTPDPNIRFNWNDPRNSVWLNYNGPRPSMGETLNQDKFNKSLERFNSLLSHSQPLSMEEEMKLKHYFNYFKHNQESFQV